MPIKLGDKKRTEPITKETIKKMVQNYLGGIGGASTDRLRTIFPDRQGITEAKCCTFPLSEILSLVADNGSVDAIRIYYGVHDPSNCPPDHLEYDGLHNVILVTCKNVGTAQNPVYQDLLVDQVNFVTIAGFRDDGGGSGQGLDMGNLCPPNSSCPGTTIP